MPNGHGIKKETYVNADEKTKDALTFDMLDNISTTLVNFQTTFETQVDKCDCRIKKVENRKIRDGGLAALFGAASGLIAGFFRG